MLKCLSLVTRFRLASIIEHRRTLLSLLVAIAFTVSCGKFFPDANSLVAISVTPSNASLQLTKTQQFTAIGSFGDGTSKDVSSTVTWSSSSSNVASINSTGLATALQTGTTTIKASQSGESGSTTLTVTTGGGGNLTISCVGCTGTGPNFTAALGSNPNFSAQDSSGQAVTATWSSSDTSVASIGTATGIAQTLARGTTTITATANGVTGTATLTVQ